MQSTSKNIVIEYLELMIKKAELVLCAKNIVTDLQAGKFDTIFK